MFSSPFNEASLKVHINIFLSHCASTLVVSLVRMTTLQKQFFWHTLEEIREEQHVKRARCPGESQNHPGPGVEQVQRLYDQELRQDNRCKRHKQRTHDKLRTNSACICQRPKNVIK